MKHAILIAALVLGGCAGRSDIPPVVAAGPVFEPVRFECGGRPLPPDPAKVADAAASAAALYEERLGVWGQRCDNKLVSVGHELSAAGQITAAPAKGPTMGRAK
jgi:hypothetical protein